MVRAMQHYITNTDFFAFSHSPRSLSLFAQNTEPGDIVLKITNILLMQ